MKLKRFLLRYEPPGIGLEVDDHGVTDVRHKDLWVAEDVRSRREINVLVDRLIADEPEILTKRRHRPALVQLLCRLYQFHDESMDGEEAEQDSPGDADAEPSSPAHSSAESTGLQSGQQVVLIGLRGNLQVHNGQLGTLTTASAEKGEYEILLHPGRSAKQAEILKMRSSDHIVPVALSTGLFVGAPAVIHGLSNHIDLNGCVCRVVRCHSEAQRYEVRAMETGLHYRMKRDNILPIQPCAHTFSIAAKFDMDKTPSLGGTGEDLFKPGSTVQVVALRNAIHFNGQLAEVLHIDRAKGRYGIRMRDGSEKTIRFANVRLVSGPSSFRPMAGPAAIDSRLNR